MKSLMLGVAGIMLIGSMIGCTTSKIAQNPAVPTPETSSAKPCFVNAAGKHNLFSTGRSTVSVNVYEQDSQLFYTVLLQDARGFLMKGPWPLRKDSGWFMYATAPDLWVFDGGESIQWIQLNTFGQSHGLTDRSAKEVPSIMKQAPNPFLERVPAALQK